LGGGDGHRLAEWSILLWPIDGCVERLVLNSVSQLVRINPFCSADSKTTLRNARVGASNTTQAGSSPLEGTFCLSPEILSSLPSPIVQ
jgi:hypothetical protein